LTDADLLGRSDRVLTDAPDLKWVAGALIIGAITFNAVLCFINTSVAPIHNSYVVGSEILIVAIALLACHRTIEPKSVLIIGAVLLYTALLAFVRSGIYAEGGLNLKVSRDFLIPIVFLLLGKAVNDIKVADRIVYIATGLILAFALFECFFLDAYLKVFGVIEYYVARGTIDALDPSLQWANGLMLNGIRAPELGGRVLLPFLLDDHRVSSLFLESISLGNFGSLVVFWAITRSRMERQLRFWSIAAGVALIVLSDNRFNASFLALGALILLIPPRLTTPAVLAMPFLVLVGLCLVGANSGFQDSPSLTGTTLQDRLLFSSRILYDLDVLNWLGLGISSGYTLDTGYAYVVCNVGLIGLTVFWLWFMSLDGYDRHFYAFRNTMAVYFAALLCVSQSQFTIKIASLLWFLLGALSIARESARRAPMKEAMSTQAH
jgi:putative polymerase